MHDNNSAAPSVATNDRDTRLNTLAARFDNQGPPPAISKQPEMSSADRLEHHHTRHNIAATKSLYAIIDSITDQIIGGIQLHLNHAAAIRTLQDIASQPNTVLNSHPLDFDLWILGSLTADHRIIPDRQRILTGAQISTIVADANAKLSKGA